MAKKVKKQISLSFMDIVLNGQADIIKQAYEARIKIDSLLEKREEAYRQIFNLEKQVDEVLGEDDAFTFSPPVCPVAGFAKPKSAVRNKANNNISKKDSNYAINSEEELNDDSANSAIDTSSQQV